MTSRQLFAQHATLLSFNRALEHILTKAVMTPEWVGVIGAHDYNYSKTIISRLHNTYAEIPEWLRPKMVRSISYGMQFCNGSKLRTVYTLQSIRGWSFSTLAICEKALEDWKEDDFANIIPYIGRQEKPELLIITEQ